MTDNDNKEVQEQIHTSRKVALVSVQAGCVTLVVAGLALAVGLFLDARLGTAPRWTLILLIGSIPLAFGGVLWLVKRELSRKISMGELIDPNDELPDH